jgi:hypothetical protein
MKLRNRTILGLIVVVLVFARSVGAQGDVRFFEPPVYNIELSGYEPPPPGVGSEIAFGDKGGGPGDEKPPENAIHWVSKPPERLYPKPRMGGMSACGYPENEAPYATLIYPDGSVYDIIGDLSDGCWSYELEDGYYGMQLGEYSVYLDHPLGNLSDTWEVDYPDYQVEVDFYSTMSGEQAEDTVLMGFAPFETLTVNFYASPDDNPETIGFAYIRLIYVASRTVEADENGAVWLAISTTRSAPFSFVIVTLEEYNKYVKPDTEIRFAEREACPNSLVSRLAVGGAGYVTPGEANRLRDSAEGSVVGSLPPDTGFRVTDGPECGPEDGLLWWRVETYFGEAGWTVESDDTDYWLAPTF